MFIYVYNTRGKVRILFENFAQFYSKGRNFSHPDLFHACSPPNSRRVRAQRVFLCSSATESRWVVVVCLTSSRNEAKFNVEEKKRRRKKKKKKEKIFVCNAIALFRTDFSWLTVTRPWSPHVLHRWWFVYNCWPPMRTITNQVRHFLNN